MKRPLYLTEIAEHVALRKASYNELNEEWCLQANLNKHKLKLNNCKWNPVRFF